MSDSPDTDSNNDSADESRAKELWVDRYLLPAIRESTLFPLLLVVIGHAVAFMAPALLFAVRDRSVGSMVALCIIGFGTLQCLRFEVGRHRRPDVLTAILGSTWVVSGVAAWACDKYHLL